MATRHICLTLVLSVLAILLPCYIESLEVTVDDVVSAQANQLDRLTSRFVSLKGAASTFTEERKDRLKYFGGLKARLSHTYDEWCPCDDGYFHCHEPGSLQCIHRLQVCDGVPDCRDGSDESPQTCKIPFKKGDVYIGSPVHFKCFWPYAENVWFKVTELKIYPWMSSAPQVQGQYRVLADFPTVSFETLSWNLTGTYDFVRRQFFFTNYQVVGQRQWTLRMKVDDMNPNCINEMLYDYSGFDEKTSEPCGHTYYCKVSSEE